ncbi:sugar ABC transporter ATP-binding protein [Williamsia muralis]|uniref:sugar ABC transporter ATP-binding protein n=1 Tax=Williamsia marianensis TaxID=85044 RepID=UPI0037F42D10
MRNISKSYGLVQALRGVDFTLRRGEVMALLGENGAGKSTLVKILAGLESADSGSISVDGGLTPLGSIRRSRAAGIAVAEQELSVIGPLSVAENIFLGGVPFRGPWIGQRLAKQARGHLDAVGLEHIDPATPVEDLSVAERQLIEIARLIARNAQILILDEPTAALSDSDIERVKSTVTRLAAAGKSIVYVTHRLGEVFEIADRITVFRSGQSNPPCNVSDITLEGVIEQMIGRPLEDMFPPRASHFGAPVLNMTNVTSRELPNPVSVQLCQGQIIGVAGQLGSGSGALIRAIAGVDVVESGRITVAGEQLPRAHTLSDAIGSGIAYCSSDRKLDGIFADLTVATNLMTPSIKQVSPRGIMSRRRVRELTNAIAGQVALSPTRMPHKAGTLSGGNQQKVALGKWLGIEPKVLLVQEPTRGVDVGARAEIYQHLRRLADSGLAIVFASSDLEEVHGLSDTIITMFRGRAVRQVPATTVSTHELLRDITHPTEAVA